MWAWSQVLVLCTLLYLSCMISTQVGIMDLTPAEPPSISDQSTMLPSSSSRGFSVSSSNGSSQGKLSGEPAQQFQPIIRLLRLYLKYLDKHPVATKAVTRCCTTLKKQSNYSLNTEICKRISSPTLSSSLVDPN